MIVARLVPTASVAESSYKGNKVSKGTVNTPPPMPNMAATIPIRTPKKGNSRDSIILITSENFSEAFSV